jgi:hypothetical protein
MVAEGNRSLLQGTEAAHERGKFGGHGKRLKGKLRK